MKTPYLNALAKRDITVRLADGKLIYSKGRTPAMKETCIKAARQIAQELAYIDDLPRLMAGPKPNNASRVYADYPDHEMERAERAYSDMIKQAVKVGIPVWFWEMGQPKPKTLHVFLKPQKIGGRYVFWQMIEDEKGVEVWI